MLKQQIIIAATALVFMGATAAQAVTITGSLTVTLSSFNGNLPTVATAPTDIKTFNPNQDPTSTYDPVFGTVHETNSKTYTSNISLNVPLGITTYNFLQIDPAGSCGLGCITNYTLYHDFGKIDSGTVTVSFVGTGSDSGVFTDSGIFTAKYSGATLTCASSDPNSVNQTDCMQWGTPTVDTFTIPGDTLTINLVNAVDWDLVPQIQLGIATNQLTTPLPASLPLFLGGLGVLGWFSRGKIAKPIRTTIGA